VGGDGFGAGVEALLGQVLAEPKDAVFDVGAHGSAIGVRGRRERGSNAAAPSVAYRLHSCWTHCQPTQRPSIRHIRRVDGVAGRREPGISVTGRFRT
jgi:hypothetical protein